MEQWDDIERLLSTPYFKVVLFSKGNEFYLNDEETDLMASISLLELSSLALLWCDGTQEEKTKFFYKVIKPQSG